ncbi:MAG: hypothetical protein H0U49_12965, partial [Parachlamydiaceae bacterium]|nr:hypothetical protein [Parachlamydiaceae bacterium]
IDQLPRETPKAIAIRIKTNERSLLSKQATDCLKHTHAIVKRIGFELMMLCAATTNESNAIAIDTKLLHVLISYLPIILSASEPNVRDRLLDRMKSLMQASIYSTHAESYIKSITVSEMQLKPLYQANCKALALTKQEPLCIVGKNLISKEYINKLAPEFTTQEKIEIVLAYIGKLLPENIILALECIGMYEKDLYSASRGKEKNEVFTALIEALISNNKIEKAKELLINCTSNKIFLKQELKATELWIKLLEKILHETLLGHKEAAILWWSLFEGGNFSENHIPEKQVKLIIAFIRNLFDLKDEPSSLLRNQLITQFNKFKPTEAQKTDLLKIIEKHITSQLSKETLVKGYLELKNKSGTQLTEESKLNLRKSYLEASIEHKSYDQAIEILNVIQKQADVEYVKKMFHLLLERLFSGNVEKEVDEVLLKQSYQLLKDVDLECFQETKFKHALKWLSAVERNNKDACVDERLYLLKMVLQSIGSDFSTEAAIVEILEHLLKSLKPIVLKKQSIPNDLKQLIISSHSKITQTLQTTAHLDIFCEYLNALHQHQINIKIAQIILPQVHWAAAEYLKKNKYDPAKLQIIHKLLNGCFQNSISEINDHICSSLATGLLAHKFPQEAMKWIERTISSSSKSYECLTLVKWCESLLDQNEPLLCLTILKALKSLNNEPSILAELYL